MKFKITLPKFRDARPPDDMPSREAANWLLVTSALVIVYVSERIPIWLLLITACVIVWRFLIDNRGWKIPGRIIRYTIVGALFIGVTREFGTIFGRDAGTSLLTALLALKLLESRTRREFLLAVFMLFFITLIGFLHSQSLPNGVLALLLGFMSVTTLVYLSQGDSIPTRQRIKIAGGILLKALPIMLVLYLLFPRLQGSLWGLPSDAFGASTGLTDKVTPGSISELTQNNDPAFRVRFKGNVPPNNQLYWRALVLAQTDGRSWTPGDYLNRAAGLNFTALDQNRIDYTMLLEPTQFNWLPTLEMPAIVPANTRPFNAYIFSRFKRGNIKEYELSSYPRYNTGNIREIEHKYNLTLAVEPTGRVKRLVESWKQTSQTDEDVIQQALRHFNQQPFRYTLQPPRLGARPVDEFMFETQAGYCEHYASTFVTLMRYAGIPTRLVVGYQGGEWNESGGYMLVKQADAHAWAESWLPGQGWKRVDPTAAIAPERIEYGFETLRDMLEAELPMGELGRDDILRLTSAGWLKNSIRGLRQRIDAFNTAWDQWVLAYGPEAQYAFLQAIGFKTPDWTQQVIVMFGALTFLMLLASAWLFRKRGPKDLVVQAYQKYCSKLAKTGLTRSPTEGPVDFATRVKQERPDLANEIDAITTAYISVRYAESSEQEKNTFTRLVAAFKISAKPAA